MYVIGSGFGTSGAAVLDSAPLPVSSWNDRVVTHRAAGERHQWLSDADAPRREQHCGG